MLRMDIAMRGQRTQSVALTDSAQAEAPMLRLVGDPALVAQQRFGQPVEIKTDPRWILAFRTSECLQGSVLPPEKRDRLISLGKLLGLSAFDCNLVIAIVQDQARRGHTGASAAAAGAGQLAMVPMPKQHGWAAAFTGRRIFTTGICLLSLLAMEVWVIMMLIR